MLGKANHDVEGCGSHPRVVEDVTISLGEATRPPGLIAIGITIVLGATSYHLVIVLIFVI